MNVWREFLEGLRYDKARPRHYAACFLLAGGVFAGWFVYCALVGRLFGPALDFDAFWGMLAGICIGSLSLNAIALLVTADSARRGILLHDRDRQIDELESELVALRECSHNGDH
jgi:hypothetical protein